MVTVASTAHTMGSVDTADLNFATGGDRKYSPWGAYGQSKAANILFAKVSMRTLTTHHSPLTTHHSPLTPHHSTFTLTLHPNPNPGGAGTGAGGAGGAGDARRRRGGHGAWRGAW